MVCAAPRVEPRVWLGDNISEAHLPTPPPHRRPQMGRDGWAIRKSTFQNIPSQSLPVGNQNWMAKNGREMGVQSGVQPGQGRVR